MKWNFAVSLTEIAFQLDFDVQWFVEHSIFFVLFVQLLCPVKKKYEFLIYYFGCQQRYIVFGDQLFTRKGIW